MLLTQKLKYFYDSIKKNDFSVVRKNVISHLYIYAKIFNLNIIYCISYLDKQLLADALIISASQKLSIDWKAFGLEAGTIGVIGFLLNPAIGMKEAVGLFFGGVHVVSSYQEAKSANTETNIKAVLIQVLIDRGLIELQNDKVYLMLK
jgi:hypothetical protein